MPDNRTPGYEAIASTLKSASFATVTLCLLVWFNVFASDSALLTSKYAVSIPGTNAEANYPVFLIVASLILAIAHVYINTLVDTLRDYAHSPAQPASPVGAFHLQSRGAQYGFQSLVYGLCPATLAGATWKAMALPTIGVPVGLIAIAAAGWTLWLLVHRSLKRRAAEVHHWRLVVGTCCAVALITFGVLHPRLIRPLHLFRADLSDAYLVGLSLSRADLRLANIRGAVLGNMHLDDADLRGARLDEATLDNVILTNSRLDNATLRNARIVQSILWRTTATKADFSGAAIASTVFAGVDLAESTLTAGRLKCVSFQGATDDFPSAQAVVGCMEWSCPKDSHLAIALGAEGCEAAVISAIRERENDKFGTGSAFTSVRNVRMDRARLERVYSSGVTFAGSDLRGARISSSYFENTTFNNANLVGTMFLGTRLLKVEFSRADLSGALLSRTFAASLDFTETEVSGLRLSGSRIIMSHIQSAKAESRTEDQVAAKLMSDDAQFEALWRTTVGKALLEGKNPFSVEGAARFTCGLGKMRKGVMDKEATDCLEESDEEKEIVTERLLALACNDEKFVPPLAAFAGNTVYVLTLMRPLVVKRQRYPLSGFLHFFPPGGFQHC